MFDECKLEGDFILNSGKQSNVFYDFDLLSPRELLEYVDKLCIKLQGVKFDFVVAPALGGILPGYLIAGEFGKRLVIADKNGKFRGLTKVVGSQYIIVDDVISTYGTAKKIAEAMLALQKDYSVPKFTCVGVAAFIFRGEKMIKNTHVLEHKEVEK